MYKLGRTDNLTQQPICIWRLSDNASIPFDPANSDYQAYLKWLDGYEMVNGQLEKTSGGNTPEPADTPA